MAQESKIKLNPSCILTVPLQNYNEDFSFLVNGEEFRTSRLKSDLLSPNICRIHANDPTFDTFIINTQHRGNFSHLLNLLTFNNNTIPESEIPFIIEAIEILGNDSIECYETTEITTENVLRLIKEHEKNHSFYSKRILTEIEYASENFHTLLAEQAEELKKLDIDTLHSILSHSNLQLESEDELIQFLNDLYRSSYKYSELYEHVIFANLSVDSISCFLNIIGIEDMNQGTWESLCFRLKHEIVKSDKNDEKKRYKFGLPKGQIFDYNDNNIFKGIIDYLRNKSGNKIENEVDITSSSVDWNNGPINVTLFEDKQKHFVSSDSPDSWIQFDFKEHRIVPAFYTVRSFSWSPGGAHPKSWVIEVSNDNSQWEIVDEQKDCSLLNGKRIAHTFKIKDERKLKEVRYFRMRQTGKNWCNSNILQIDSFEIYGSYI